MRSTKQLSIFYLGIKTLEVRVGLSSSNKDNWLTTDVGHGDGGAHLVIDGVELGEDNAVNGVGAGLFG